MPKLFYAGWMHWCYASECKISNEIGKGLERVFKLILRSKANFLPVKQSVKFKCKIWSEITKKFAKKRQDASSLCLSRKIST